jgi:hypothetical protein
MLLHACRSMSLPVRNNLIFQPAIYQPRQWEFTSPLRSNLSDLHEIDWLTVERIEINYYPFHRLPRLPCLERVRSLLERATERVGGIPRQCMEHQASSIVQHGERVMVAFGTIVGKYTWALVGADTSRRERSGAVDETTFPDMGQVLSGGTLVATVKTSTRTPNRTWVVRCAGMLMDSPFPRAASPGTNSGTLVFG